MTSIVINPIFDAFYYSYYIHGFFEVFGRAQVRFAARLFPDVGSECLSFIVRSPEREDVRVCIDAYDGVRLTNLTALDWCHLYAKVNLTRSLAPEQHAPKCVAIGPSFPVRVWSRAAAWLMALRDYRLTIRYPSKGTQADNTREHFANYYRQSKYRLPLREFTPGTPGTSRDDYVFYKASLWSDDEAPGTNQHRADFIESCKSVPGVRFEGGLVPVEAASPETVRHFAPYYTDQRVALPQWLDKIRASTVVFNTPAVWYSHAWKLPEFMALGKAIITTPLVRELPTPMIHGEHVHFVDGSFESTRDAVHRLVKDREYRRRLEQGAREYYTNVLSPSKVIERLVSRARTFQGGREHG